MDKYVLGLGPVISSHFRYLHADHFRYWVVTATTAEVTLVEKFATLVLMAVPTRANKNPNYLKVTHYGLN